MGGEGLLEEGGGGGEGWGAEEEGFLLLSGHCGSLGLEVDCGWFIEVFGVVDELLFY